jgi:hypothetical protein
MRQVISVAAASLLLVLLTACGSDGLSQEEFVAQANEICQAGTDELTETFEAFFPADAELTEEDFQQIFDEHGQTIFDDFVSNTRGQIDDIRDLNGPSDLEDQLDPILDEASEILDNEVVNGGPEELFFSEGDPFADINPQLEALGLTTCAEAG